MSPASALCEAEDSHALREAAAMRCTRLLTSTMGPLRKAVMQVLFFGSFCLASSAAFCSCGGKVGGRVGGKVGGRVEGRVEGRVREL